MNIPINHRMVLIIGPTTSGKTTLSYKLKKTAPVSTSIISQDEVVHSVIDQDTCGMLFSTAIRKKYGSLLREAIKKPEELIVLDMLNIHIFDLFQTMFRIKKQGYFGKITLLKMNLSFELHDEFCGQRKDFNIPTMTTEKLFSNMISQLRVYQGSSGSLHHTFPFTEQYLIQDPREVEFTYSIQLRKPQKKLK